MRGTNGSEGYDGTGNRNTLRKDRPEMTTKASKDKKGQVTNGVEKRNNMQ